jgi:hypothetical protein
MDVTGRSGSSQGPRTWRLAPGGWYQVGDGDVAYVLTLTLAFAQDLDVLVGSRAGHAAAVSAHAPAYLYYSLLGNDVVTEPFYGLPAPTFAAERAFVRLRGTEATLAELVRELATVNVFACIGTTVLGFAEVDLAAALLHAHHNDDDDDVPVLRRNTVTEGICPFYSPEGHVVPPDAHGRAPVLGVTLSLVREADVVRAPPTVAATTATTVPATPPPPSVRHAAAADSAPALSLTPPSPPPPTAPGAGDAARMAGAAAAEDDEVPAAPTAAGAGEDWRAVFRQSDEYRVAMQLELWRHEEELRFKQDLDDRMAEVHTAPAGRVRDGRSQPTHITAVWSQTLLLLQQEWQRREAEREAALARMREQLREDQERVRRREEELQRLAATSTGTGTGGGAADRAREGDLERSVLHDFAAPCRLVMTDGVRVFQASGGAEAAGDRAACDAGA